MAKKKIGPKSDAKSQPSFEQALENLERIAGELEDGELGLSEALVRYEEGVKHLQQCYRLLQRAERKIELLSGVDSQGNPVTEAFDDEELSLEEKAASRTRRRSRSGPKSRRSGEKSDPDEDVDEAGKLF